MAKQSKPAAAAVVIFVLLFSILAGMQAVSVAQANFLPLNIPPHDIEITADGSVIGTNLIQRSGTVYTFLENLSGCIVVSCDRIVIDGAGHTLQGDGSSTGIFLEGRRNVTVQNITIANYNLGVLYSYYHGWQEDCADNIIRNSKIINNTHGVNCYITRNITFTQNTFANNSAAIVGFMALENRIISNTIADNEVGVEFTNCDDYAIYANNFVNNTSHTLLDSESKSGLNFGWSVGDWNSSALGNFWSDNNGTDSDRDGVGDTPYVIDVNNQDYFPLLSPLNFTSTLPGSPSAVTVSILSPVNGTNFVSLWTNDTFPDVNFPLTYVSNEALSWVGYSIDGKENVTVFQNGTLVDLPPQFGNHSLTLYANDTFGNFASPKAISFLIVPNLGPTQSPSPSPSPTVPEFPAWIIQPPAIVVGLVVYLAKRRRVKH